MRCIYCALTAESTTFNGREHVVPKSLGVFEPVSMLLDEVCDGCNGTFSREFEDLFKKDTYEGLLAAQLGLRNPSQIVLRSERLKLAPEIPSEDGIFDALVPQINPATGLIEFREQVVFEFADGPRHVLFVSDPKFPKNLKAFVGKDCQKYIFAANEVRHAEIEQQLIAAGISFKLQVKREINDSDLKTIGTRTVQQALDAKLCRLPAKIAFNYFAWTMRKVGLLECVYGSEFDAVRHFILKERGTNPVTISADSMVCPDGEIPPTAPMHFVIWRNFKGYVIGEVSLFMLRRFTVCLGALPKNLAGLGVPGMAHRCELSSRKLHELDVVVAPPPFEPPNQKAFPWGIEQLPDM